MEALAAPLPGLFHPVFRESASHLSPCDGQTFLGSYRLFPA